LFYKLCDAGFQMVGSRGCREISRLKPLLQSNYWQL
jgi:hypothetical protein